MSTPYKSWAQVLPALMLLLPLPSSGQSAPMSAANEAAMLEANGMEVLGGNEFVEERMELGAATEEKINHQYRLSNGKTYNLETNKNTSISLLEGNSQVTTYVQPGPNDTIHSMDEDSGPGPERIDSAIGRKFSGGAQTVPVIIEMSLPFEKFYEQGQNAATIAGKQSGFDAAKSRVAGLLRGNSRMKHDLKIIGAVSAALDQESLDRLSRSSTVKRITLDRIYKPVLDASPDELRARETWNLFDGNNLPLTGYGKTIAIIDTGVDYTHPDLGGCLGAACKVIGGYDFVNNDPNPMDDMGHGTHVAATAAGNGLLKGIAPDAKILAYKVCTSAGSCPGSATLAAIQRATDPNNDGNPSDHADVANMSLGGPGNPDDTLSRAVDNSVAAGVVHVISAGNSGPGASTIGSPGTSRTAITVAAACAPHGNLRASACAGPIASFSSRGPLIWNGVDIQKPDIAASGVMICAARWASAFSGSPICGPDATRIRISGTSMAAPHMAGAAALVRQAYPTYTPAQIKQHLKSSARSLGMSYNDQGAGMVDLRAAIPGSVSTSLSVTPVPWIINTNPTLKLSTTQQTFSVTPTVSGINTLNVSLNLNVPGMSVSFSKTLLQVSGNATDSFQASFTADNDQVKSGSYMGTIVLSENGATKGVIPLLVTVRPTLVTAPAGTIDYGIDSPTLTTWDSGLKAITLTNLRQDVPQTVSVSSSAYPAGITFQSPSSLTVAAGGSASLNTRFIVDNTLVANGFYGGKLALGNQANAIALETKFTKFYVLTISDSNSADLINARFVLHNRQDLRWSKIIAANPFIMYLSNPGTYDMMFSYQPSGYAGATVLKEAIPVTGGATNISVSRSEAVHKVTNSARDISGNLVSATLQTRLLTYLPAPALTAHGWVGSRLSNYYSNISSNYKQENVYVTAQPTKNFYAFYDTFTGISGPLSFGNAAGDLKKTTLRLNLNLPDGTGVMPIILQCGLNGDGCWGSYSSVASLLPLPFTQQYYSTLPSNYYFLHQPNVHDIGCSGSAACASAFQSPMSDPVSKMRKSQVIARPTLMSPIAGDTIYTGLGPSVWFAAFANTASKIQFAATFDGPTTPLMRQDYSLQEHEAIPYTIYKDGVQFATGNFPRFNLREALIPSSNNLGSLTVAAAGNYEARVDFSYKVKSQSMLGRVSAKFNNGLADPDPPIIKRLYYFTNNARSEVYDASLPNRLEFVLHPLGGTISQAAAAYSSDGVNFTPLPVTSSASVYSADLPSLSGLAKLALRIEGTDSSGNSLSYTFELPSGQAPPDVDSTPPAVSVTAPAGGSSVSGSVSVTANASDNVGVLGVQFKLDGANLGAEDTASPYSLGWNTTLVANGAHTLTAVARDAAGNTATAPAVTVTVNNLDTTPPSVSITAPAGGSTLFGTVTIAAAASDNVGVAGLQFKLDGVSLAEEDTSAPYSLSWNTTLASAGAHTLTAVARDAAGNLTVSAAVAVTVSHTDVIPPTAAILSPSSGANVKQNVSVSVSASDNPAVSRIELWADGALAQTKAISPAVPSATVSFAWRAATKGLHTLQAKAYDAAGNSGSSSLVTVNVTGKMSAVSLVGAGGQALGEGSQALMLSLQQAKEGAALAFSEDIAETALINLRGQAIIKQSRQGNAAMVMPLRQAMEAGLWLIEMKDNDGRPRRMFLTVVK